MIGIYKITSPSYKIYIGQSVDWENRMIYYRTSNCKSQPKLYNSIQKHGWKYHKSELIEECNLEQLNEREMYWINYYDSVSQGLNCLHGGEGGGKLGQETKDKISKSMKGKNNWSIGGYTKKPILQYTLNGEFIKEWENSSIPSTNNLSLAARGICKSAGGYIWLYTQDFTPELLIKRVNDCKLHKNTNKPKSQTHKNNISKGKLHRFKSGKTILQYTLNGEFIKEWESVKTASINLNINYSSISSNLTQKYKSAGGYVWKYKNNDLK